MIETHSPVGDGAYAAGQTLLILGASPDQLPLYQAARKAGAVVIGADANPNSLSRPLADRFLQIKSRNAEEIITLLDGRRIDGVVSPGNDSFHQTIYDLCGLFDLPNRPSKQAVDASCDKGYFSSLLQQMGLSAPSHCASTDFDELNRFVCGRPFPLIVKPADSSGSKGLSYLTAKDQFPQAYEKAASFSPRGLVIAEDYIAGEQFGVEAFRLNGRCVLAAVSRRGHTGPPDFLVTRHNVGFALPPAMETLLVPAIDRIADRLGIANGPLNFDIVFHPETGICFLEMGARLSGNGFPALVRETYGVNTPDWMLRLSLGHDVPGADTFRHPVKCGVQHILTSNNDGRLREIVGMEAVRAHPAFRQETLFVNPGDPVHRFQKTVDRLGVVLLAHEDPAVLQQALTLLDEKVSFEIEDAADMRQEEKV